MKVHRYTIACKAFRARVAVQNGRVVSAGGPLKWAVRGRWTTLVAWMRKQHADWTMTAE